MTATILDCRYFLPYTGSNYDTATVHKGFSITNQSMECDEDI